MRVLPRRTVCRLAGGAGDRRGWTGSWPWGAGGVLVSSLKDLDMAWTWVERWIEVLAPPRPQAPQFALLPPLE